MVWSIAQRGHLAAPQPASMSETPPQSSSPGAADEMFVTAGKYVSAVKVSRTYKSPYLLENTVIPIRERGFHLEKKRFHLIFIIWESLKIPADAAR